MYEITLKLDNVSGDLLGLKEALAMMAEEYSDVLFVDVKKIG